MAFAAVTRTCFAAKKNAFSVATRNWGSLACSPVTASMAPVPMTTPSSTPAPVPMVDDFLPCLPNGSYIDLPSWAEDDDGMQAIKRQYQPSNRKRQRAYGYLRRLKTSNGRNVLNRRRHKGRWSVGV